MDGGTTIPSMSGLQNCVHARYVSDSQLQDDDDVDDEQDDEQDDDDDVDDEDDYSFHCLDLNNDNICNGLYGAPPESNCQGIYSKLKGRDLQAGEGWAVNHNVLVDM